MKSKIIRTALLLVMLAIQTNAQNNPVSNQRINIGDIVPDYQTANILNYANDKLNLQDFKGKILILDFWTFECTACVSSWPKLLALQQEFKDKIQILLVNERGTTQQVQKFVKRQEKINKYVMNLPIVYNESRLSEFFPHSFVPHVIFIDQHGIVKYIPHPLYLNRETIKAILKNNDLQLRVVSDNPVMAQSKPIFINGYLTEDPNDTRLVWSSVITPYMNNAMAVAHFGSKSILDGRAYGWIANHSLEAMVRILQSYKADPQIPVPLSRRIIKDLDSTNYVGRVDGILQLKNLYTAQLTSERNISVKIIKKKMLSDIQECFGIESSWEKQRKKCIVISKSGYQIPKYKSGEVELATTDNFVKFNNVTISDIIQKLEDGLLFYTDYPILDETGIESKLGRINLDSDKKIDFRILQTALIKFGLKLSIEEREIDMLVITRNKV
ncbi:Thiol-disulfide isomerase or thioredoxin [Pedobacter steynii]|uniref:Thiol-disulfide isomerase or thioredoxin n=1 Tax=Pedobacter steynii TaxID=430522 RepID=A0A1G9K4S6_9SPHI|nr:TlpA disulfide reductase family protein [Pedobacter steynii]NQX38439.1 TlpA family protein disulfide reductase [Pedobacter steynii]SDL44424.1 Thiol-disulfide isomerase or thioredoxin [Pedobacter steynii]